MNLMIIESAGKLKKIKEILGKNFIVMATLGHFRELSSEGVDGIGFNQDYVPLFQFNEKGKGAWKNIVDSLNKYEYEKVYVASDPDREGEAIAWHIIENLPKKYKNKIVRVKFNEITKNAIIDAINNPVELDRNLIEAQFCRQIYDKDFGFKISRFIKTHTKEGKSLGRVQGVVVNLLSDRDKEIKKWKPIYRKRLRIWINDDNEKLVKLVNVDDNLKEISYSDEEKIDSSFDKCVSLIQVISNDNIESKAPIPYKTSTLLQDILNNLKLNSNVAQSALQWLYEKGLITYPRTDSYTISQTFINDAKEYIENVYGKEYVNRDYKQCKNGENAQEGHECLRITHFSDLNVLDNIDGITKEYKNIYKLIFNRSVAMLMSNMIYNNSIFKFRDSKERKFIASSKKIVFSGWKIVYGKNVDEQEEYFFNKNLYEIKDTKIERYIQNPCPKLYKEASIIKELEKKQIGRPSTYATFTTTILNRNYAYLNENKELVLSELGKDVQKYIDDTNWKIGEIFINYDFTANFEKELDDISNGKISYKKVLEKYHNLINKTLNK